jgi:hypothetical protein
MYTNMCMLHFFCFLNLSSLSLSLSTIVCLTSLPDLLMNCLIVFTTFLPFFLSSRRSFLILPFNNQIYYIIQFRSSSIVSRVSTRYDVQPAAWWDVFFLIRQFSNDCFILFFSKFVVFVGFFNYYFQIYFIPGIFLTKIVF